MTTSRLTSACRCTACVIYSDIVGVFCNFRSVRLLVELAVAFSAFPVKRGDQPRRVPVSHTE